MENLNQGHSYKIFTTIVSDCVSLLIIAITAPVIVSSWRVVFACYSGALGIALLMLSCGVREGPSARYTQLHKGEWQAHAAFLSHREAFFDEAVSHRVYECGEVEGDHVMRVRRQRTVKRDAQGYMRQNRTDYIKWILPGLPTLLIFLFGPALQLVFTAASGEIATLTAGTTSALLAQMASASVDFQSLVSHLLRLNGAIDCVKAFSDLLNLELSQGVQRARASAEAADMRAAAGASGAPPRLYEIALREVLVRGVDLAEVFGDGFTVRLHGVLPLGRLYGLRDDAAAGQ
eukprot:5024548-Prymnesium_polylepis.6